ncbi:MAG TPA: TonB-dependent receptor [Caulobacterales bacterium]|nr:TonB-dependent receptor [Caulobacterales bacterium]
MTAKDFASCWGNGAGPRAAAVSGSALGGIASVLALALATTPALAQEAQPAPQASSTQPTASDEVVVTAQKRTERLLDVPIAISVVDPALLQNTNARNLSELQGVMPSVFIASNHGGGKTYVTIRGATGTALNTGDEPVAIYMDDVYQARGVTIGMVDLLDVQSVEIVRGPQGTLQGRNATAGAILLTSADPTPDFQGYLTASVASPQEVRAQGAVSGPLGGGFEGRVALGYVDERGWMHNLATNDWDGGAQSMQGRGVLKYDNGGAFDARLVYEHTFITNEPALFRYAATQGNPSPTGPYVLAGTATPDTPLPADQYDQIFNHNRMFVDPGTSTRVLTDGATARMSYDFGGAELISVTGWRKVAVSGLNDSDGLATMPRQGYNQNHDTSREYSQELRLQSTGAGPLSWIVGLYAFDEHQFYLDDIFNLRFSVATNTRTRYTGTIDTKSYAAFGDATYHLTDQLSVVGGVRYTQDDKDLASQILTTNLDTSVTTTVNYQSHGDTWSDTTYRAKLVYKPDDNLMFYASYGTGFRAGGYNPFAVQVPYNPEGSRSTEIGAKGSIFDRRLTYSVAAYHNSYTNLQLRAGVPTGGAIITNAGAARVNGLEVEFEARPDPQTRLIGNFAYTDAIFTSFKNAVDPFNHFVDATGNTLVRTPKWQYFFSGERDFSVGALDFTAELNYRWRDKVYFYFTDQDSPTWQGAAGGELGARLTLHGRDDVWTASLYGTNLTNERLINSSNVTFSYPLAGLNKPRSIGISVERHF